MDSGLDRLYAEFGSLFAACFETTDHEVLVAVNRAGHRLGAYFTLIDHLVDAEVPPAVGAIEATRRVMDGFADLTAVLGDHDLFWGSFRPLVDRWLGAFEVEAAFCEGRRPLAELTMPLMAGLAADRGCVAGGTPALLASLSARSDRVARLRRVLRSIDAYSVAQQLRDDVLDWRTDLKHRRPNFVLARLGELSDVVTADPTDLARLVHAHDVGRDLLGHAVRHTRDAQAAVTDLAPAWSGALGHAGSRLEEALRLLDAMPPPPRGTGTSSVTVSIDRDRFPDQRQADGAGEVLRRFQHGRDLRHVMVFPEHSGVSRPGVYVGDVFSRAMALNCLIAVDDPRRPAFAAVVDRQLGQLQQRRDPDGDRLWRYFPGFPDLSPDLDTFAEVGAALLATGRMTGELRRTYLGTADLILARAADTGRIDTWIYSRDEAVRAVELHAATTMWGRDEDLEVVANLAWFLLRLDGPRYRDTVRAITHELVGAALSDRTGSTWYTDCGYAEFVLARLVVASAVPDDGLLERLDRRAAELMQRAPHDGLGHLRTAFFLLVHALATDGPRGRPGPCVETDGLVQAAWQWLADETAAEADQVPEPFVRMDLGRVGDLTGELHFASDLLQRGFGLRALQATWRQASVTAGRAAVLA